MNIRKIPKNNTIRLDLLWSRKFITIGSFARHTQTSENPGKMSVYYHKLSAME